MREIRSLWLAVRKGIHLQIHFVTFQTLDWRQNMECFYLGQRAKLVESDAGKPLSLIRTGHGGQLLLQ